MRLFISADEWDPLKPASKKGSGWWCYITAWLPPNCRTPNGLKFTGVHLEPRDSPVWPWKVEGCCEHDLVNLNPGHYITTVGVE